MEKLAWKENKKEERRVQTGRMFLAILISAFVLIGPYPAAADPPVHFGPPVKVMTRNLYLGADIFAVVKVGSPDLIPLAVAEKYAVMVQNDFAERARAIAMEISEKNPDLIGCQEVARFTRLRPTGDPSVPLLPVEHYDYLELLLDALQTCGLEYEVAAVGLNADTTLPMIQGIDASGNVHLDYVNYLDRDVILAKKGIVTENAQAQGFSKNFSVAFSDTQAVVFKRGFVAVDATVRGRACRFVNAHVENEGLTAPDGTMVQQAQVAELMQELSQVDLPVLLVGDFNLPPSDPDYDAILGAGFTDLWASRTNGRHKNGSTCCQDEDLLNEESVLTERIDYIFARHHNRSGVLNFHHPVIVQLTGNDADEAKTESGLWPSDHAGVFAAIRLWNGRR
jgi:endonuclease/exonuclease/phosphatase family metal-dependent hydrolase